MEPTKREAAGSNPVEGQASALPERYEEIVTRLNQLVERLEGGGLSLEDAITAFEQGIQLARRGAEKLDEAEHRVEVLLEGNRTERLAPGRTEAAPAARPPVGNGKNKRTGAEEDIPF